MNVPKLLPGFLDHPSASQHVSERELLYSHYPTYHIHSYNTKTYVVHTQEQQAVAIVDVNQIS